MNGFWPDGVRCGVALTFDLDAETLWLSRAEGRDSPVMFSQGAYGVTTGVPRILSLLRRFGVNATFFIPGKIIEDYTGAVRRIVDARHEIGYHSYTHSVPTSVEQERQEIRRCWQIMEDLLGVVPAGYRAPDFEVLHGGLDSVSMGRGSTMFHSR
ncbi:MAG: polysaccharide deacetylase family protein [Bacillota bacterium]